jgi:hypothetical protein
VTSIAEQFTADWLMSDLVNMNSEYMQSIAGISTSNIVHPISLALDILNKLGVIGGDPLIYVGSDDMAHGDFIFNGQNTQKQIASMFIVIKQIFGENNAQALLLQLQQQWQKQIKYFGEHYGFRLYDYDFVELSGLS